MTTKRSSGAWRSGAWLSGVRQAAKQVSLDKPQGFLRCACTGTCMRNTCKCKASGQLCNTRCHRVHQCKNMGEPKWLNQCSKLFWASKIVVFSVYLCIFKIRQNAIVDFRKSTIFTFRHDIYTWRPYFKQTLLSRIRMAIVYDVFLAHSIVYRVAKKTSPLPEAISRWYIKRFCSNFIHIYYDYVKVMS